MRTPTIGRIVRYVLPSDSGHPGQERPAMVTGIFADENVCNLTVFCDQADDLKDCGNAAGTCLVGRAWSCHADESKSPGTWHWPEIV